jgi:hypothetical protein
LETKDCNDRLLAATCLRQHADANAGRNSERRSWRLLRFTKAHQKSWISVDKIIETALCNATFGHHCSSSHRAAETLHLTKEAKQPLILFHVLFTAFSSLVCKSADRPEAKAALQPGVVQAPTPPFDVTW